MKQSNVGCALHTKKAGGDEPAPLNFFIFRSLLSGTLIE
jgi:hypothetical protein